jgi:homoserine kinase type II
MLTEPCDELRQVLSHYDLGELIGAERDRRGTVNVSYSVETVKDGRPGQYFLRCYRPGITLDEIRFEHSLIEHLVDNGVCPVARLHRTRSGSTFYVQSPRANESMTHYYAIFDFIHGEDRYTWVDPHCTPHELRRAGELLAAYHAAVSTLVCNGKRVEKKIVDLLEEVARAWDESPARSKGTVFDRFLAENFELVRRNIAETRAALDRLDVRSLPELVIHCDFHPGNLVFAGEEISGLVDFDWSKVDLRAFDVALAVWYFSASWEGTDNGVLRLDDAHKLLEAYQQALLIPSACAPLSPRELTDLPDLISAANLYVLYWSLRDFFGKDVNPEEYLVYLKHGVACIRWFGQAANLRGLSSVLAGLPRP